MKVEGAYKVTFNNDIGGYELGECSERTVDYVGDDIEELAKEVCGSDRKHPLTFESVADDDEGIVGVFLSKPFYGDETRDELVVAVMY